MCCSWLLVHPVEKIIHRNRLCPVNPFTSSVYLRVGLDGSNHGGSGHVHLASLFNNPLQGRAEVPLALLEKSQGMR